MQKRIVGSDHRRRLPMAFRKAVTSGIYLLLIILFAACRKEDAFDCFKSNGPEVTETRAVSNFRGIKVYDKIDLVVSPGAEFKVEVKAGRHIIKNISTEVKAGMLEIVNHSSCNFVRGYKRKITVTVTMPLIDAVESWGVGTVTLGGFTQDSLRIVAESSGDTYVKGAYRRISSHSNGNGDVYLDGSCDSLRVYMNGTNFLHAATFPVSNYLYIETLSMGDCFVNTGTGSTFECRIYKNGNVYYSGSPSQVDNLPIQNSKGRLIREN